MSNGNEHLHENQKVNITPAAKTTLDPQAKCIAVLIEPGKNDAYREFAKLGGFSNKTSWLIPIHHEEKVKAICKQYNLIDFIQPIPENFEILKNDIGSSLLESEIEQIERSIKLISSKLGISWVIVEDLRDEEIIAQLRTTKEGSRIIDLLLKHEMLKNQFNWFHNQKVGGETISATQDGNPSRCISIKEALKASNIISTIQHKISQFKETKKVSLSGISTGYEKLDTILDGLISEHFIVLAGRTGMGKSWAALNLIRNIALMKKIPIALFSLEMSNNQMLNRLIAMQSGVSAKKIKNGSICAEEFDEIIKATGMIAQSPLFISDNPANSKLTHLIANIDEACQKNEIKMIVIDHIGLVKQYEGSNNNRANEVGEITRAIKMAAKRHKIPILCLAQLNRNADQYETPKLSQLRESGALEQDSDVVLFVNRCDYYNPEERRGEFEIIVAKNRDGEQGITIPFMYDSDTWVLSEVNKKEDLSEINQNENIQPSKPESKYAQNFKK